MQEVLSHLFLRRRVEAQTTHGADILTTCNVTLRLLVSVEITLRDPVVVAHITAVQLYPCNSSVES